MSKNLSEAEFWWMVGILEGEGFFGYQSTQRVAVSMTDEDTMIKFHGILSKITGKQHRLRDDQVSVERQATGIKATYTLEIYGDNARMVMLMVVPHMSYRRKQKIWQSLNGHKAKPKKLNIDNIVQLCLNRQVANG